LNAFLGTLVWLVGTWGAYRLVLGQSVLRSWAALAIFATFLGAPVGALWIVLRVS
jgi:hypothetical protein